MQIMYAHYNVDFTANRCISASTRTTRKKFPISPSVIYCIRKESVFCPGIYFSAFVHSVAPNSPVLKIKVELSELEKYSPAKERRKRDFFLPFPNFPGMEKYSLKPVSLLDGEKTLDTEIKTETSLFPARLI